MSDAHGAPPMVESLGGHRFLVRHGRAQSVAYAVVQGQDVWIWLDGFVHVVRQSTGSEVAASGADDSALAAAMPARVRSIAVKPGDRVSAGDVLLVLEAMKMELSIKAPRDGTVARITCRQGDLVEPGVPLIELDQAP